jgi:hypothetical protein
MIEQKEIDQCYKAIKNRLDNQSIDLPQNSHVKEGYIKTLEILKKKVCNYTGAGIENLSSTQSKAIAILAVDYLKGECDMPTLANIPIWTPPEKEEEDEKADI